MSAAVLHDAASAPRTSAPISVEQVRQLLFLEARHLDQARFDDWLGLFAADGTYWIPAARGQTDPLNVPSIIYENRDLLAMRVSRLVHPRTYIASPRPSTTHLVGNVEIVEWSAGGDECRAVSVVLMHECREQQRRLFSGHCSYLLRRTASIGDAADATGAAMPALQIVSKRVDLIDCDAVQSAFMIPL